MQLLCSAPELPVPSGLVDHHDAAGWVGHVSRDGVDGKSVVVKAGLIERGFARQKTTASKHMNIVERGAGGNIGGAGLTDQMCALRGALSL